MPDWLLYLPALAFAWGVFARLGHRVVDVFLWRYCSALRLRVWPRR